MFIIYYGRISEVVSSSFSEKFETVLRKEQEGYGIQLHGQYPVVVDNVRPGKGRGVNQCIQSINQSSSTNYRT